MKGSTSAYLLCPAKDHLVVDLNVKLVTSTAVMVEYSLSLINLDIYMLSAKVHCIICICMYQHGCYFNTDETLVNIVYLHILQVQSPLIIVTNSHCAKTKQSLTNEGGAP